MSGNHKQPLLPPLLPADLFPAPHAFPVCFQKPLTFDIASLRWKARREMEAYAPRSRFWWHLQTMVARRGLFAMVASWRCTSGG